VFTCPFPAPAMIEKAWNEMILYSENYHAFCKYFLNGVLDKRTFEN
jgi:hypothetical protein